jgi:hypothetical protein
VPNEPKSPEAAALEQLLAQLGHHVHGDALQQALGAINEQTWVGGKRVTKQELPKLTKSAATTVHRVKVTLYGSKPPIWRRLEIPSTMPLDELHEVLQTAFDWDNYHLHQFETVCGEFGDAERGDDWSEYGDETDVAIAQVAATEKSKVVYTYDFGDDWRHDLVVEKIIPAEPGVRYPRCTAGRGQAPEEDSGGIWEQEGTAEPFDPAGLDADLSGMANVIVAAR